MFPQSTICITESKKKKLETVKNLKVSAIRNPYFRKWKAKVKTVKNFIFYVIRNPRHGKWKEEVKFISILSVFRNPQSAL